MEKERQPVTSVLQDSGLSASFEAFLLYLKFRLRIKVSAKIPLPRKAVNRYMQAKKTENANYSMWQDLDTKVSFVQTLVSNGI